ncbi:MAG: DUF488 domain-containing protein [Marinisporobacter sp.]|jgi:uncharacterized protein (DUF488 family)|nr:DUF488 domain-containing protein [Marinisporobacter sp.]
MNIYTIGHTNYSIENFVKLIRLYNINCIVDVRSTPFSKYTPQFNRKDLKITLNQKGVHYIYMGIEFGARRNEQYLYTSQGYLDFEKTIKNKVFLQGVRRLVDGCEKGFNISLMCTEKDPFDCHRSIMVGKGLKDNGFDVKHIFPNGNVQTQEQIEQRLLDKYFKNRFQVSLESFFEKQMDEEEMIAEAYRKRNKEIGYEIGGRE